MTLNILFKILEKKSKKLIEGILIKWIRCVINMLIQFKIKHYVLKHNERIIRFVIGHPSLQCGTRCVAEDTNIYKIKNIKKNVKCCKYVSVKKGTIGVASINWDERKTDLKLSTAVFLRCVLGLKLQKKPPQKRNRFEQILALELSLSPPCVFVISFHNKSLRFSVKKCWIFISNSQSEANTNSRSSR
ncbi:unnamed protein product [Prunus armeniaca]